MRWAISAGKWVTGLGSYVAVTGDAACALVPKVFVVGSGCDTAGFGGALGVGEGALGVIGSLTVPGSGLNVGIAGIFLGGRVAAGMAVGAAVGVVGIV